MSLKNIAKWVGIAGAAYLAGTAISNELFDTNFKTIGNWDNGTWSGAQNTDANLGNALAATTSAAVDAGGNIGSQTPGASSTGSNSDASSGVMGLLGKAGTGLLNLAKSPGGGTLLAGALQGLASGKASEQQIEEARRYKRAFTPEEMAQINGGAAGAAAAPGSTVGGFATGGYLDRARRVSEFLGERRQAAIGGPAATPSQVANYARGG